MATEGIEAVFLETRNWGKAAKFFQALGFELEFATDHASGQLRNGEGPYVFIAEVPEDSEPGVAGPAVRARRRLVRRCPGDRGVIPPSQFGRSNPLTYALLILAGVLAIGIVPPLLMDRLRRPGCESRTPTATLTTGRPPVTDPRPGAHPAAPTGGLPLRQDNYG